MSRSATCALNRSIPTTYEDLQDNKELLASARAAITRYWSVFGSAVVNPDNEAGRSHQRIERL
jgi:hypothetical protein